MSDADRPRNAREPTRSTDNERPGLITARRAGPLRRFGKSVRRHPVVTTIVIAAVLLAGIGSLTIRLGRQKETADALRAVAEIRNLIHAGRYLDALRQADTAYREHPGMADLRLLRGYALIQMGRLDEAVEQARRRLESDPDDWVAHSTLLHAALKSEFLDSEKLNIPIEEHLRAVETLAPESAHIYYLRTLSAGLGTTQALPLLNRALELDPGHADALVLRINMLAHQGDFEAAILDCERLTAVRPRSSQGRRLKAYTYRRQLELESALATINQAIDLEPGWPPNYHQRAAVYQLMGRTEEALADRTRTVEMASRIGWYFQNRSWLYETMGRGEDAIIDAETAHEADPHNLRTYPRLLDLYRRFGRDVEFQAAMDRLERLPESLVRPRTRARAHRICGYHGYEKNGQLEQALVAYAKAIESNPRQSATYLLRGRLLLKLGRGEGALADYGKALEVEPGTERPYRARGWALTWLGRPEEALSDFSEAINVRLSSGGDEADPDGEFLLFSGILAFPVYEETYLNRARLLLALGRIDEAFADYDRAAEVRPRSQAPSLYRGLALLHLGRLDESIVEMNKAVSLGFDGGLAAIEEWGINPWAHWGRALASVFQPGSCDRVEADLDRALELGRADPAIWTAVARTRAAFVHRLCPESYEGARTLDLAGRAVRENRSAVERYGALGLAQYRSGLYEPARESMTRALVLRGEELLPDELPMAMILWKLGEREAARDFYRRAVEGWPYPEDPGYALLREEAAELLGLQP